MLAKKIKKKRREQGYSQDHMADQLGITPSAYGKIERGETRIDVDRLKQIVEVLQLDIMDLLDENNIVVTQSGDSTNGDNGIAINPSYQKDKTQAKVWHQMLEHLKEEITVIRQEKEQRLEHLKEEITVLRQEKEQLLKLVEKLTDK